VNDTEPAQLHRLHPLTPLVRGAKVFGALTAFGVYRSWQAVQDVGFPTAFGIVFLLGAAAITVSWIGWRFTGYRVTGRELHIQAGILARRHRTVPLERVQAIDVVRPVLARLLGLAELRLEVVGGTDTEARLSYLSAAEGARLREELLALASGTAPATNDSPAQLEQPLFQVDPKLLAASQLITPYTLFLPFLLAWPIISLAFDGISIATVFGAASAIVGIAAVPARRFVREFGHTVSQSPQGLRIRGGLLERRTQTVTPGRVQAVRITRPLLWRPFGWVRVDIDVAGYHVRAGNDEHRSGALVPVADERTAHALVRHVLPDGAAAELDAVTLTPVPRNARWLAPLERRQLAAGITGQLFVCCRGWLAPNQQIAVLARIQSIRYTQGPLQRALGLASVRADLAGGHAPATAEHQDATAALALLSLLVARTRATRVALRP
jgi:putative membrane protein